MSSLKESADVLRRGTAVIENRYRTGIPGRSAVVKAMARLAAVCSFRLREGYGATGAGLHQTCHSAKRTRFGFGRKSVYPSL